MFEVIDSLSAYGVIAMQAYKHDVTFDVDFLKKTLTERLLPMILLPVTKKPAPIKR